MTAPNVSPATICFCTANKKSNAGTIDTKATAAMVPQLVPVVVTNSDKPVGIVLAWTLVRVEANKYSFHANKKLRRDVTAMPGAARGIISFLKIVNKFAPSTTIASSSSFGIPSMIPFKSHIAKGRLKTQYSKINPIFVSKGGQYRRLKTVENNKNKGNKKAAGGAILLVMVQKKILSEPGNLNLDRAYVAIRANTVTKAAFEVATIMEFKRYSP